MKFNRGIDKKYRRSVEDAFAAQETAAFVTGDGVNKPKGFLGYSIVADASQTWGDIGYVASGAAGAFADASGFSLSLSSSTEEWYDEAWPLQVQWLSGGLRLESDEFVLALRGAPVAGPVHGRR